MKDLNKFLGIERRVSEQTYDRMLTPYSKISLNYIDWVYLKEEAYRVQEAEILITSLNNRVQELEEKLNAQIESNQKLDQINRKWMRGNKRYREAIKSAIGKFNYDEHQEGMATLREVLEESE